MRREQPRERFQRAGGACEVEPDAADLGREGARAAGTNPDGRGVGDREGVSFEADAEVQQQPALGALGVEPLHVGRGIEE